MVYQILKAAINFASSTDQNRLAFDWGVQTFFVSLYEN